MSYRRVLPRDLFNEGDLLNCYGKLAILTDGTGAGFIQEDVSHFEIVQDPNDGSLTIKNLDFQIGRVIYPLFRPLNARSKWPLWFSYGEEDIRVFHDLREAKLSFEILRLINGATL